MTPARGDLTAYRWVPFDETIPFEGVDFTGADFAMQVRAYPDAPGAALISLATASPDVQGVSVAVATVASLTTSSVRVRIDEAVIEQLLPFPASGLEPNQSLTLAYDLVITTQALGKRRWLEGAFIIAPGVTQA